MGVGSNALAPPQTVMEDRDDAVAQRAIERPCSPGAGEVAGSSPASVTSTNAGITLGAGEGHSRTKSPKTINHPAEDDCSNERPDNYFEPSAASNQVGNEVASSAAKHSTDYGRDL